jgi:hypothetical protein
MRSPSLTIPRSLPSAATTGTALIRLDTKVLATSRIDASGLTVTTFVTITSAAFIVQFPAGKRPCGLRFPDRFAARIMIENADPPRSLGLLRTRRERPHQSAAMNSRR